MGSKGSCHAVRQRTRTIERLEDRQMMSADPISNFLGGAFEQHVLPNADFWIDTALERDVGALVGDLQQTLASAHNSTGLTSVRNDYGFIGAGQTVAVIDSGIAWNHVALGGGLGSGYRVVGGWDFTENDADPYDDGPWGSHGTHVAGIVGGNAPGTTYDGVATGVDLVGLRVFDDNGAGYFSWVESALRWVHENRNAFENPITAVNLSLGTSWNESTIPNWAMLEDEFAQLEADGIFIAVSAGNAFSTYNTAGLSYPAVSSHVVPVMSVMDDGNLSSFSQRHTRAIGAPGQYIVSSVPDYVGDNNGVNDDFASYSGTSMAAPYIAGASVLIREAMQFVGYTNITQDTIYDHMMATATSFFDAATNQTYKRINLVNAFSALMPADDYGSTATTAYNLGTLSGDSELSGLIGKLSDADFFRFTAASNGTVTFTASTTHGLVPVWTGIGGVVSGPGGNTFTFHVTAGQSYTFGLSTSGGIGYYDLAVSCESDFSYSDCGVISQSMLDNISCATEQWYGVTAGRSGIFTFEALLASSGGNVDLQIYDRNLQLVAAGVNGSVGQRIDLLTTAGTNYFVRLISANSDIDLRLTNLVSQGGSVVTVSGTELDDDLCFSLSDSKYEIDVNGVSYEFVRAAVNSIKFDGGAGYDSIAFIGSIEKETTILRAGATTFIGTGFIAEGMAVENVIVYSGGGDSDIASLYDTSGDDTFVAWSDRASMAGAGYSLEVVGFARVDAFASLGSDRAFLYDSAGDDLFRGYSDRAIMSGTGFMNRALGFDEVEATASTGRDLAQLYDSAGDDMFVAGATVASMTGEGYLNRVLGFDQVDGIASSGHDVALFNDTDGNDIFNSYHDRATMSGAGYFNRALGFKETIATASGGYDLATLFDSTGDDKFDAWFDRAVMSIDGRTFEVRAFDRVNAIASFGNDVATLYDSAADDRYYAYSTRAMMVGNDYYNGVWSFDRVDAWASTGYDFAILYDSAGDDLFLAGAESAVMTGSGYYNRASGFDRVDGFASQGYDVAHLYDSAGADVYETYPTRSTMAGPGYLNRALYFDLTQGYRSTGNDIARMFGSAGDDYVDAWSDMLEMRGVGYRHQAIGFASATAYGQGGTDRASMYDTPGNDLFRVRDWGAVMTCGERMRTVFDFDEVVAHRVNGGDDRCDIKVVDYLFSMIGGWS